MLEGLYGIYETEDIEDIKKRISNTIKNRDKSKTIYSFGFDLIDDKLVENENEIKIIKLIFNLRNKYSSDEEFIDKLKQLGIIERL